MDLKPISMKIPVDQLERIDALAHAAHMTRTAFMIDRALKELLPRFVHERGKAELAAAAMMTGDHLLRIRDDENPTYVPLEPAGNRRRQRLPAQAVRGYALDGSELPPVGSRLKGEKK